MLPISYRLIVLDTALLVKKSLNILNQNGIVSAPLWDSKSSTFAGLLTTSDYINVIQYYWQNPDALARVDQFRLDSLRGGSCASDTGAGTDIWQKSKRPSASNPSKRYLFTLTVPSTKHVARCSSRAPAAYPSSTAMTRHTGPWSLASSPSIVF